MTTATQIDFASPNLAETNGGIRELSPEELTAVSGGFLPVIGFALALASHVGVGSVTTSVAGHFITGFSLGYATYSMSVYFGGYGGGGGGRKRGKKSMINSL